MHTSQFLILYFSVHQTNQRYSATGVILYTGSMNKDSGLSPVYLFSGVNVFISAAVLFAAYFPVSLSPLFSVPPGFGLLIPVSCF